MLNKVPDVLLICPTSHRPAISHYIHSADSSTTSFSSLRIEIHTHDQSQDIAVGTSAILRHFAHRIQQDFIILPCDFIPPESLSLTKILNTFRTDSVSDGAIATTCWFESAAEKTDEWDVQTTPVSIVWDEASCTLLHIDNSDEQEKNGNEYEFRLSLLAR
jgi:translation initiation factor eIF-2B subunit gamma